MQPVHKKSSAVIYDWPWARYSEQLFGAPRTITAIFSATHSHIEVILWGAHEYLHTYSTPVTQGNSRKKGAPLYCAGEIKNKQKTWGL